MNLTLTNITKRYDSLTVFENFSAAFGDGEITSVLGRSGSGKTTLLSVIGNLTAYSGSVKGADGGISFIFQKERLLPNLTVRGNLDFVLKGQIASKAERTSRIDDILKAVELYEFSDKYPLELSGGMQQRVSMARAFIYNSNLLLMDEPFRSLDIALKNRLIAVFLKLWETNPKTTLFVTHDIDEAILLSDKIMILGESPAKILSSYEIKEAKQGRNLADKNLLSLRAEIYGVLSKI